MQKGWVGWGSSTGGSFSTGEKHFWKREGRQRVKNENVCFSSVYKTTATASYIFDSEFWYTFYV